MLLLLSLVKRTWSQFKFGILGGGQLARLLCLKGHEMGLKMFVLSENKKDPAAQVTQNWIQGSPYKEKSLKAFLSQVDSASFENEFLNADHLQTLSQKLKTPLAPRPSLMGKLQDRLEQKKQLIKAGLSTPSFLLCKNKEDKKMAFQKKKSEGLVFKKRRSGYDGHGTFIFPPHSFNKFRSQSQNNKMKFLFQSEDEEFIVEDFVPFKRELALSVARNRKGQMVFLPLVESYQERACCLWVKGPIQHSKLVFLKRKIKRFLNKISYQGVMAFELFDLGTDLLVNEIAPRVHNSAHYSLNALSEDQFTLHLKACLNLPLKRPFPLSPGFAMLNLLGKKKTNPSWEFPSDDIFLHWYGKSENRTGRKMGHLNALASHPTKALLKLLKIKKNFSL